MTLLVASSSSDFQILWSWCLANYQLFLTYAGSAWGKASGRHNHSQRPAESQLGDAHNRAHGHAPPPATGPPAKRLDPAGEETQDGPARGELLPRECEWSSNVSADTLDLGNFCWYPTATKILKQCKFFLQHQTRPIT